jgi:glutamyl-tRNA synthetase
LAAENVISRSPVRVRVAPSPTGDPHIGTAYQALFNYVFARQQGGRFILRIEDTDRVRSTRQSEQAILESLRWMGLMWDEGPDIGGPHAPYRQSERTGTYREHVRRLLEAGDAYRCFCTQERLEQMRAANRDQKLFPGYDRSCRDIPPEVSIRRADGGEPFVVRMKVPLNGSCIMRDLLRGEIHKDWAAIDDQVLLKSDQFPTYHLANVVDDHLMGITHVIRGEEWINSVPKHLKLYEYFGWEPPIFCHLPLLRNSDPTRSKLSKRKNPTSIGYYRRAGFLPEALLNFIGLMGWSRAEGDEKFTLEELIRNFRLEDISLGGPVFDIQKLRWLNGRYIRENYDTTSLREALERWALGRDTLDRIIPLAQPRLETLSDWGYLTAFFFADEVPFDPEKLKLKGKTQEELLALLQIAIWRLEQVREFTGDVLEQIFRDLAEKFSLKLRDLLPPFYVAVTGTEVATPLFQSMEVLGSDLVRMRLRRALGILGGFSTKGLKAVEKTYETLYGRRE